MKLLQTEPVMVASSAVAAISAVVTALIAFGVISWSEEQTQAFMGATVAILGIVGPLVAGWYGRLNSTPNANPKTKEGEPLVPISQALDGSLAERYSQNKGV